MENKYIEDMVYIKRLIDNVPDKQKKATLEVDFKAAHWTESHKEDFLRRFNKLYNEYPELFI